jgi:ABC-type glycerol-3-phosphate transport system substrate-binding protein
MKRSKAIAAGLALAAAATQAHAHHSGSMFDPSKTETVQGVVRAFNWTNPHVNVEVMAEPEAGKEAQLWTLEASSPGVMGRSGWTKRSLNPGDHVTVTFSPLRDGGLGGSLRRVQFPDGKVLTWSTSYTPGSDAKP